MDEAFAASRAGSGVGRFIDVGVNTYLPGDLLVKVDITTMANSLEARSPFLDHHLMEWAAGLPTRLKVRAGTTKYLLKKAVAPWLPAELVGRPKMGFGVPLAAWLRTEPRELAWDVLTDRTARSRGFFRPEEVSRLLVEHQDGRDHGSRIWALVQFELWHRMFLSSRTVRTAIQRWAAPCPRVPPPDGTVTGGHAGVPPGLAASIPVRAAANATAATPPSAATGPPVRTAPNRVTGTRHSGPRAGPDTVRIPSTTTPAVSAPSSGRLSIRNVSTRAVTGASSGTRATARASAATGARATAVTP